MKLKLVALGTPLLLMVSAGSIELVSRWELRHEQASRAYLGDQLFVETRGDGRPIVFLAGLEGSTAFWEDKFDALARDHRMLLVDALGFGRSPWPDGSYALEDHLGALRRTLVARGAVAHVTIVGHSFGAVLAAYYAAAHPEEIEKIYLLGAPVFEGRTDALQRVGELSPLARLFTRNRVVAREVCVTMGALRPWLRRWLPRFPSGLPAGVARDSVQHCWPALDGTLQNVLLEQPISIPVIALGQRVVFVQGLADRVTPMERVERLAHAAGAEVVPVSGGHLDYPATSSTLIVARIEDGGLD